MLTSSRALRVLSTSLKVQLQKRQVLDKKVISHDSSKFDLGQVQIERRQTSLLDDPGVTLVSVKVHICKNFVE